MSHTNTTANYNLPQFIGTDKPSWLTDVNGAMTSIDTQMKANADANTTTAGNLASLTDRVTTAEGNISTNASSISTVANVANTAGTNATNALNKANSIEAYLAIDTFASLTATVNRGTVSSSLMRTAHNASGTFGKVYGKLDVSGAGGTSNLVVTLSDTGLRPEEAITINSCCSTAIYTSGGFSYIDYVDIVINTDGTVTISVPVSTAVTIVRLNIVPFVIFAQNFGD